MYIGIFYLLFCFHLSHIYVCKTFKLKIHLHLPIKYIFLCFTILNTYKFQNSKECNKIMFHVYRCRVPSHEKVMICGHKIVNDRGHMIYDSNDV